jgi:hypothetical protein
MERVIGCVRKKNALFIVVVVRREEKIIIMNGRKWKKKRDGGSRTDEQKSRSISIVISVSQEERLDSYMKQMFVCVCVCCVS